MPWNSAAPWAVTRASEMVWGSNRRRISTYCTIFLFWRIFDIRGGAVPSRNRKSTEGDELLRAVKGMDTQKKER